MPFNDALIRSHFFRMVVNGPHMAVIGRGDSSIDATERGSKCAVYR